jgi:hypothetical protein
MNVCEYARAFQWNKQIICTISSISLKISSISLKMDFMTIVSHFDPFNVKSP